MAVLRTIAQQTAPNSQAEAYNGFGRPLIGTIVAWVPGYYQDGSNAAYTRQLGSADTVAAANAYLNPSGWYVCDGAALNDTASPIFGGATRYLPNLSNDRFLNGVGAGAAPCCGGTSTGDAVKNTNMMLDHYHALGGTAAQQSSGGGSPGISSGTLTTGHSSVDHSHQLGSGSTYVEVPPTSARWVSGVGSGNAVLQPCQNYTTSVSYDSTSHNHSVDAGTTDISHTHTNPTVSGTAGSGSVPTSTENRPKYLTCFYIVRVK